MDGWHILITLKAIELDRTVAQAGSRTTDINGRIAAADNDRIAANRGSLSAVYAAEKINAAENALKLLALNVQADCLLKSDGKIKRLVALLAQLGDSDILSNLNAAPKLDAHSLEHLDLGVDDIFFKPERGDALCKHAAGDRVFIKNGHGIAHICQEIRTAHAGRACADDGDLLRVIYLVTLMANLLGNVSCFCIQLTGCDELLYCIDGDRLVYSSSGAGIFAALVAN